MDIGVICILGGDKPRHYIICQACRSVSIYLKFLLR